MRLDDASLQEKGHSFVLILENEEMLTLKPRSFHRLMFDHESYNGGYFLRNGGYILSGEIIKCGSAVMTCYNIMYLRLAIDMSQPLKKPKGLRI